MAGKWIGVDHWNPRGDADTVPLTAGSVQWGKVGSGIEHGVQWDPKFKGNIHGFQLWVNLPAEKKLDPPYFQDALADSLPPTQLADGVAAKVLVGEGSPIDTGGVSVTYIDFMLEDGGSWSHPLRPEQTAAFLYVYEGQGSIGANRTQAKKGEIMKISHGESIVLMADAGVKLGALFIAGAPLKEPIIQHGPFVMSSKQQIMEAFQAYQTGQLCDRTCSYTIHRKGGPTSLQRTAK